MVSTKRHCTNEKGSLLTTTSWGLCGTSPSSRAHRTAPRPSCTPTPVSTSHHTATCRRGKREDLDESPLGDVSPCRLEPLPLAGERGLVAHHRRVEHLVVGGLLHVVGLQDVLPLQRLAQDRALLLQVRIVRGLTT